MICRCGFNKTEQNKENHNYCQMIPDETVELLAGYRRVLEKLARIGNGASYGNSNGNVIAQEGLKLNSQD